MATRSTLLLLFFALFSNLLFAQKGIFTGKEIKGITSPELEYEFSNWRIFDIDAAPLHNMAKNAQSTTELRLRLGNTYDWVLQLTPDDIFASNFQLSVATDAGIETRPKGEIKTFGGYAAGSPENHVRMTLNEAFIFGYVEIGDVTYFIEPAQRFKADLPDSYYIVYRTDEVLPHPNLTCGWSATEHRRHEHSHDHAEEEGTEKIIGNCYTIEIALAADFLMFQAFSSNVGNVQNFMTGVLNNVQTNYDNEFADQIQFQIVTQFVVTSSASNPWTNSTDAGDLLESFRDWGNSNGFGVTFDVASLWTNRNFNGTTIGVAWLGGVCNNLRYNTLQNFTASAAFLRVLQAHELGHNFDANHDDEASNTIMAPSVNASTAWSAASISAINSFVNGLANGGGCLSSCGTVVAPPEAAIVAPVTFVCPGSVVPLIDNTTGGPTSWNWIMPGATPANSNEQHPVVKYNLPGNYVATLVASNSEGTSIADAEITVSEGGDKYLIYETFEAGPGFWEVFNPDNSITWEWVNVGGTQYGKKAMGINNFGYTATNQKDALISPPLDLSTQTDILLEIDYAYRRFNASRSDKMIISVSTNGGTTYPNVIFQGQEMGSGNFATASDSQTAFSPTSFNDWCYGLDFGADCLLLDLSNFSGESNVRIKIENQTAHGNNMYIDNIRVSSSCISLAAPEPDFIADVTVGCAPLTVQFEDVSTGIVSGRFWNFPGGSPSTAEDQFPLVTYNTPGSYEVSLQVSNSAGFAVKTESSYITVLGGPVANFSNTVNNLSIQTSNLSTNATSYIWNFGDGSPTSTATSPAHTYTQAGTYTIRLTAINECGQSVKELMVTVISPLTAAFSASATQGCAPLSVTFSDQSQGNATSWMWTFEGGTPATSTAQNPTVTFSQAGTYNVSLTVGNGSLQSTAQQVDYVVVNGGPTAAFATNASLGNNVVQFANNSTAASNYEWFFGDDVESTEENPSHTYEADGAYTVTLVAHNACGNDTSTQTLIILLPPTATFTQNLSNGCQGLSIVFTAVPQGEGLTYAWTFEGGNPASSDAPNPTVSYATAGTYDVQLIVSNAAGADTVAQSGVVIVSPNPQAAFTANGNLGEAVVQFGNTSTDASSYQWFFGDDAESTEENPSHTYEADGTYIVTLVANNACGSDTTTQEVTILLPPNATFTQSGSNGCEGLSVDFTAAPQGEGLTYAWTFEGGNPASSDLPNPTISYATAGTYDVQLIVSNAAGADTIAQNGAVIVSPNPQAAFTAIGNLGDAVVQFGNTSTDASSYQWFFGDDSESTEENPSHTYEADGTYTVTLVANNACGSDTTTQEVTILLPPNATFTQNLSNGCEGLSVDFTAAPQGEGLTYAWTFEGGNPASSDAPNPTVSYATAGTYDVQLIVSNAAGADTIAQNDVVNILGGAAANFSAAVNGFNVNFENNSIGGSTYFWDFGDENTSDAFEPSHVYEENGVFLVTLIAVNACGNDTISIEIIIDSALPVAAFSFENSKGCAPLVVQFSSESVNADSVHWTFPGGTPSSSDELNPTITYTTPGIYNATIVAYNMAGSGALTQMNIIEVGDVPNAAFDVTQDEGTVNFANISENADSYEWHFGDGETSTENDPVHEYSQSGDYLVQLIASNLCGSDTITKEVNIVIVSIEEVAQRLDFKLYPNPNSGNFMLEMEAPAAPWLDLKIYDALGRLVYEEAMEFRSGQLQKPVNLANAAAGVYWITLQAEAFNITRKVVIGY